MKYKTIFIIICSVLLLGDNKALFAQTTDTFYYKSDTIQTWKVPSCTFQVTVQLWAGGGGGGGDGVSHSLFQDGGGSGAYYEGIISGLTAGTILDLYVPSGGKHQDTVWGTGGKGGWPGGGKGGCSWDAPGKYYLEGGGGGGYAAIQINGTYYVVVGAGGGGGTALMMCLLRDILIVPKYGEIGCQRV